MWLLWNTRTFFELWFCANFLFILLPIKWFFFLGQVSCKKRILLCNSSPPINRTFNEADKCLIRAHKKWLVRGWSPQIGLYCTLRSLPFLKITRILTTPHGTPKLLEIFSIVLFEGIQLFASVCLHIAATLIPESNISCRLKN